MTQLQQAKQGMQQLQLEKQARVFGLVEKEKAAGERDAAKEHAVTQRDMLKEDAETQRVHLKETAQTHRDLLKIGAEQEMNTQDNRVSMVETFATLETNEKIAHQKAQQHGVPNNNRPTNQQ